MGEAFIPHATKALAELRAGTRAVEQVRDGEAGRLTLAIAGTIPNTQVLQTLRAFRDQFPAMQLQVQTGTSNEVSQLVENGEADLGIRYFPGKSPVLESQLIAMETGSIVAANPTGLLNLDDVSLESLSQCPWIMFPIGEGSSGEPMAQRALALLNQHGIRPDHVIRIDGLSAQKRLLASDFGLAVMQESAIADELAAGSVQRICGENIRIDFPIHLVSRINSHPNAVRNRLVHLLIGTRNEASG